MASLQQFRNIEKIYGIEIYKPYVWECKFNIIDFYLKNPKENKPEISIIHNSVFDYNFKQLAKENTEKEILNNRKSTLGYKFAIGKFKLIKFT